MKWLWTTPEDATRRQSRHVTCKYLSYQLKVLAADCMLPVPGNPATACGCYNLHITSMCCWFAAPFDVIIASLAVDDCDSVTLSELFNPVNEIQCLRGGCFQASNPFLSLFCYSIPTVWIMLPCYNVKFEFSNSVPFVARSSCENGALFFSKQSAVRRLPANPANRQNTNSVYLVLLCGPWLATFANASEIRTAELELGVQTGTTCTFLP